MRTSSFRRTTLVLLLAAFLTTPWASAAGLRTDGGQPAVSEAASWDLFDRVWGFLESIWSKTGCHLDPNGVCEADPAQSPQAKEGCHIDPFGGCKP